MARDRSAGHSSISTNARCECESVRSRIAFAEVAVGG